MALFLSLQTRIESKLFLASEVSQPSLRVGVIFQLVAVGLGLVAELFLLLAALLAGHPLLALAHGATAVLFAAFGMPAVRRRLGRGFVWALAVLVAGCWQMNLWDTPAGLYLWLVLGPLVLVLAGPRRLAWIALPLLAVITGVSVWLVLNSLAGTMVFALASLAILTAATAVLSLLRSALRQLDDLAKTHVESASQTRFLEALLDLIPFPIFYKNFDGQFVTVNASFGVVFDAVPDNVAGRRNDELLSPSNAKSLAKIELDVLARDSMAAEEAQLTHADGRLHDFIVYMMPFQGAEQATQGYIGVMIDITERKQKEQKLLKLNETKDQLFSIISHDLRSPVGKIKQLLDVYVEDQSIFDRATWDQVFQDMRKSSDSLFQLLENLLSWAHAQQGAPDAVFELFALEPVVNDVFALVKLMGTEKKISLSHELKLTGPVLTDKPSLSTILRNLVNNAIKFTRPSGWVKVRAGETDDEVFIVVEDNGVGMDAETLDKIFGKRQRITTYGTGKEKGQGIGLGLCLDLVETLGARLTADSTVGVGTKITLHLPTLEL